MLSPAGMIEDDAQLFFANAVCQSWAECMLGRGGRPCIGSEWVE